MSDETITCADCGEVLDADDANVGAEIMSEARAGCSDTLCEECANERLEDLRAEADDYRAFGPDYQDELIDGVGFADPGGRSALRAATRDNPRDQPCPSCGAEDALTPADVRAGYCCDRCADRAEGLYVGGDY